jgi:hypothetical protein
MLGFSSYKLRLKMENQERKIIRSRASLFVEYHVMGQKPRALF